jgi:aspartyl-tRNA(Asn)/glutamyl-tRNA(Gln) amidotransferase subunit C
VALSREEVAALGRLARIELTAEELDHLAPQMDQILEHVAQVSEVAAADIQPTSHPLPLTNVFRADEIRPCLSAEAALSGAPSVEEGRFRVPRILGESA